jgi:hypothetical protein
MIDTPIRYKVLDYTDKYARVYYVDEISGDIVDFAKKNDKWEFDGWDTIWSNGGTADGVLWPYLWDSLKGKIRLVLLAIVMSVYILITIIILRGK